MSVDSLLWSSPGQCQIGAQREFCRAWPNQQEITVKGAHFLQEESPNEVGEATAQFVAKLLAGQLSSKAAGSGTILGVTE